MKFAYKFADNILYICVFYFYFILAMGFCQLMNKCVCYVMLSTLLT